MESPAVLGLEPEVEVRAWARTFVDSMPMTPAHTIQARPVMERAADPSFRQDLEAVVFRQPFRITEDPGKLEREELDAALGNVGMTAVLDVITSPIEHSRRNFCWHFGSL
jgi:hypothetical protein